MQHQPVTVNKMDISGLSNSGLASLATTLSTKKLQDTVGIAVQKISNDQIKQDGSNMLQLINAAGQLSSGNLSGQNVNLMA